MIVQLCGDVHWMVKTYRKAKAKKSMRRMKKRMEKNEKMIKKCKTI